MTITSQEELMQDSPTTATTNAMTSEPGFPAETVDGEIVNIVGKESAGQGIQVLVASDGSKYVQQTDSPRLLVPAVEDGTYEGEVNAPVPPAAPADEEEEGEAAA